MLLKSTVQLSLGWIFDNPLHFLVGVSTQVSEP